MCVRRGERGAHPLHAFRVKVFRELICHDDQTMTVQTETETDSFKSQPRGHGPRLTFRAVAVAARAAGALTATTWAAVAM